MPSGWSSRRTRRVQGSALSQTSAGAASTCHCRCRPRKEKWAQFWRIGNQKEKLAALISSSTISSVRKSQLSQSLRKPSQWWKTWGRSSACQTSPVAHTFSLSKRKSMLQYQILTWLPRQKLKLKTSLVISQFLLKVRAARLAKKWRTTSLMHKCPFCLRNLKWRKALCKKKTTPLLATGAMEVRLAEKGKTAENATALGKLATNFSSKWWHCSRKKLRTTLPKHSRGWWLTTWTTTNLCLRLSQQLIKELNAMAVIWSPSQESDTSAASVLTLNSAICVSPNKFMTTLCWRFARHSRNLCSSLFSIWAIWKSLSLNNLNKKLSKLSRKS